MCGIFGQFGFRGLLHSPDVLARATNLLAHRGPDGGACWHDHQFFLGHRRLAVIDLSARGTQPMASAGGRFVISFNGEIYNYKAVRAELNRRGHVFATETDTEVLLQGFEEWGTALLPRLQGMFAFALCDRQERTLLIARDPFGEKPLFYCHSTEGITFASELGPIAALASSREVDFDALGGYLSLNYVPGNQTLLAGVHRVAPGSWVRVGSDGERTDGRYFHLQDVERTEVSGAAALDSLEERIDCAVAAALTSDVPVGVFLSGGVDSAVVSASALRSGSLTGAYCLTFDDARYDEWPRASATAAQLKLPIARVNMGPSVLARFLQIVNHADDPLADSSALALYTVAEAAKSSHRVMLSGDGGDELFGGYLTYQATLWHRRVSSVLPGVVRKGVSSLSEWLPVSEGKVSRSYKLARFTRALDLPTWQAHLTWNGAWLPQNASRLVRDDVKQTVIDSLSRAVRSVQHQPVTLRALQQFDIAEYLANDILAKADRMTMAHGLEVRAPLLSPTIARFVLGLPDSERARMFGPGKRILRTLATQRYALSAGSSPKQGFSIPIHHWTRARTREMDALLAPDSLSQLGFLDVDAVRRAVEEHTSGRRSLGWEVWGIMVLVAWYRARVLAPPALPDTPVPELKFNPSPRVPFKPGHEVGPEAATREHVGHPFSP